MIEVRGNVLHVIPSGRENFYDVDREWKDDTRRVHIHSPGDWSRQATEGALIWVLYSETYRQKCRANGHTKFILDVLPVTQKILIIREDIVEELRHLTDLEASLNEIFLSESSLVDPILTALRWQWSTLDDIHEGKQNPRAYTENPPGYVDIWDKLQDNDTFKELQDNFHPFSSGEAPDLAQLRQPVIVLAKVIIAVSSIRKWPREQWSVKSYENGKASFIVPPDPMDELLPEGRWEFAIAFFSNDFREAIHREDSIYLE